MQILAHRGASGEFPENSLLAFEQAIVQKANAIELDVHFHRPSKKLVVIHDHFVDNISNSTGHFEQFSFEQLTQLPLGEDQKLPSLSTALKTISGQVAVNIELKTVLNSSEEQTQLLIALRTEISTAIEHYNFSEQQLILSSFDHHLAKACLIEFPNFSCAGIIAHNPLDNAQSLIENGFSHITVAIDCLSRALVENAHRQNKAVWVYTVDNESDIKRCMDLGIDAIFTNYPRITRNFIDNL